jgi:hypothetical protein
VVLKQIRAQSSSNQRQMCVGTKTSSSKCWCESSQKLDWTLSNL